MGTPIRPQAMEDIEGSLELSLPPLPGLAATQVGSRLDKPVPPERASLKPCSWWGSQALLWTRALEGKGEESALGGGSAACLSRRCWPREGSRPYLGQVPRLPCEFTRPPRPCTASTKGKQPQAMVTGSPPSRSCRSSWNGANYLS